MQTKCFKVDWLIPVLGIAMVAGCLVAATIYREFERQADAERAFMSTLVRLSYDHKISAVLKNLHDGEVDKAAHHLDLLLCWDILCTDAELASADVQTRACVASAFQRMARLRPTNVKGSSGPLTGECSEAHAAAQRILELASKGDHN